MCTFHNAWCQWSQPRAALTYMFVLTPRAAFERLGQQFRLECTWVATCQKVGPKQQLPHECSSSLWSQEIAISNICFNRHLRLCNRIYGTFSLSRIQTKWNTLELLQLTYPASAHICIRFLWVHVLCVLCVAVMAIMINIITTVAWQCEQQR